MHKFSWLLIPGLLYATYLVFVYGYLKSERTYFYLGAWHLLPLDLLLKDPLRCLLLLHSQPPVTNVLLWAAFAWQGRTGMDARLFVTIMFCVAGLISCMTWYRCAEILLRSRRAATLLVLLIVINPSFWLFDRLFTYTNLELCEMGLFLLAAIRWSRLPTTRRLIGAMIALTLIVHTRSLYHPMVGVLFGGLAALHLWRRGQSLTQAGKQILIPCLIYAALVAPWMIKNKILFRTAAFSSWIGLNFKTLANDESCPIWVFVGNGTFSEKAVRKYYPKRLLAWYQREPVLAQVWKDEKRKDINLNHYAVPPLSAISFKKTLEYIRLNPKYFLWARVLRSAVAFDLPSYYRTYTKDQKTGQYRLDVDNAYSRWLDKVYYGALLRPRLDFDWLGIRVTPSLFIMLWFPLAMLGSAWRGWRLDTGERFIALLMVAIFCWLLPMVLVIDGAESARMRWHLEPMYLIMLGWSWMGIGQWIAARILARRAAAPSPAPSAGNSFSIAASMPQPEWPQPTQRQKALDLPMDKR